MPRVARIVVPGVAHHVTQRGNNQQDIFFVEDDRRAYLELLHEQGERYGFRVEGYCLMTNHVHVIGVPAKEDSLALAVGRTNLLYTQYVNERHGRTGHLWQNRFYSCAMDESHTTNALCYVELNPVRAGIVKKAWEYSWSSAAAHCGAELGNPFLDLVAWRDTVLAQDWKKTLEAVARDAGALDAVRRGTHTGRPLGSDTFLSKIEHVIGRRVRPLPIGRPKGWRKAKAKARKDDGARK